MNIQYRPLYAVLILCFTFISSCFADWTVNSAKSRLSYISIKNDQVAETNHFNRLSGKVTSGGEATISIDMASIETGVSIRNERVKEHLFHTSSFPTAQVMTQIGNTMLDEMNIGTSEEIPLALKIKAIGQMKTLTTKVVVTRLTQSEYLVFNQDVLMLNAADFDKTGGLAKLQELAKLNTIESLIPMSFQLYLEKQ